MWNAAAPAECNGQLTTQPSMTKPLDLASGELQTRMSPVFHVPGTFARTRTLETQAEQNATIWPHPDPSGPIWPHPQPFEGGSTACSPAMRCHVLTDKELCQAPMAKPGWLAGQVSISPTHPQKKKKNSLKESVSKESKDSRHL